MSQNIFRSFQVTRLLKFILPVVFSIFAFSTICVSQTQTQTAVSANIATYMKGYYESLPVDYKTNTTKKYPLLIFLHGSGEKGNGTTDLPLVLKWGPPRLINEGKFPSSFNVGGKSYSFIVISPQISSSSDYVAAIRALINHCKEKYRVDETKVYLTGLSLGGLLTFNFCGSSQKNSEIFAAILAICGGSEPTAARINNIANAKLPVWITNNSGDPIKDFHVAEETVRLLNAHVPPPPEARLTIFNINSHDAWTPTYDPNFRQGGLNVYEWMLSYSRGTSQEIPTPPVAEAGTNQTITLPLNTVTLDGSKSSASSGYTIKTYAWSKLSGPSGGTITTPSGKTTTVTDLVAGTYVFQLKVTDSNGGTNTDTVTITVDTASTSTVVANAGSDATVTLPTRSTTLDGSKSTVGTGNTIKSYSWSKVSGPANSGDLSSATSSKPPVSNLVPGVYVFQLKVTDNTGKSATDNVTITVKYVNGTLKANAGPDQSLSYPLSAPLAFDGSASTAPSAGNISCSWTRLSGPDSYGAVMYPSTNLITRTAQNLVAGTYQYQLTVRDDKGNSSTDVMVVTITNANSTETSPPIAEAGANQAITLPANSVTIDAGASIASAGTSISSYQWTKKSGPASGVITSATSAKTTVTGLVAGTYEFEVLVTDNKGKTATDVVTIIVNAASTALKADAGDDQVIIIPTRTVTLNGANSTPPSGGKITGYEWSKVSGPNLSGNIVSASSASTSITDLVPGIYVFKLTITDNTGKAASDNVKVIVRFMKGALKANAGPDQSVTYPLTAPVILDGGGSTVPAPSTGSYTCSWTRLSGPGSVGAVLYPSVNLITRTAQNLTPGVYEYQLTVRDDQGNQSKDVVVITVKSSASARTASATTDAALNANDIVVPQDKVLDVKINPNPVTNIMTVWIDGSAKGSTSVLVYNTNGTLLQQQSFVKDVSGKLSKSFNVAQLPTGTYYVKVLVDNKVTQTVQMIKK
ncbi:MAG: T9SS type A sorting domain-containing protein [Chitinophagaceae bacterium]|nr:T9SS type A sorting domain-containing protein [Chitinophagaceae bacterium]